MNGEEVINQDLNTAAEAGWYSRPFGGSVWSQGMFGRSGQVPWLTVVLGVS